MKKINELNFYEMLSYSTTRIVCKLKDGGTSTGTGFFITLNDFDNEEEEPRAVLITNKHVIENAVEGKLTLTTRKNGFIANTEHFHLPHSSFESSWILHPEEDVDLCMLNFQPYEILFTAKNIDLFYVPLSINLIPNTDIINSFDTMEEVFMIGYPNGIWDSYNNKPIFRKGITATDYRLDYENKSIFIIDMAVFGGSSGSPVLWTKVSYNENEKNNHYQLYLMGILYAGFIHTANGEIEIEEIPQMQSRYVQTQIPNNLGLVIKAEKLNDFRKMFYPKAYR